MTPPNERARKWKVGGRVKHETLGVCKIEKVLHHFSPYKTELVLKDCTGTAWKAYFCRSCGSWTSLERGW
jgi:hypothetical protein